MPCNKACNVPCNHFCNVHVKTHVMLGNDPCNGIHPSAGRGVHSRAQSARALPGVLMAKVRTLRVEIFQGCTLFLRVLQESAHFF